MKKRQGLRCAACERRTTWHATLANAISSRTFKSSTTRTLGPVVAGPARRDACRPPSLRHVPFPRAPPSSHPPRWAGRTGPDGCGPPPSPKPPGAARPGSGACPSTRDGAHPAPTPHPPILPHTSPPRLFPAACRPPTPTRRWCARWPRRDCAPSSVLVFSGVEVNTVVWCCGCIRFGVRQGATTRAGRRSVGVVYRQRLAEVDAGRVGSTRTDRWGGGWRRLPTYLPTRVACPLARGSPSRRARVVGCLARFCVGAGCACGCRQGRGAGLGPNPACGPRLFFGGGGGGESAVCVCTTAVIESRGRAARRA